MSAIRVRGPRRAAGFVWACLAALLLSVLVPSFAGVGAASSLPASAPRAVAAWVGGPSPQLGTDPPAVAPTIVATVNVGTEPEAGAVDLASGLVYVANEVTNNVSVLRNTSNVATVPLPGSVGSPVYVVYDGVNGYVYVVDHYYFEESVGAVSVLSGTSVAATIGVGPLPDMAVVDPSNGYLYVTNSAGSNVSVIDGTTVVASVPVGMDPWAAAYDPLHGDVYVANEGSGNVSVLAGTAVIGNVPAGSGPVSVAYDPADGYVYVANNASANVTVLSGLSVVGSIAVGADPSFVGYNPSVGGIEVTNTNSNTVTVINGTAAVATLSVAADPVWAGVGLSGTFTFVVGAASNEVTVLEGTAYVGNTTVGSVPVYGIADPANELMYVTNSGSNTVTVFAIGYPVLFNETGLASVVNWSVTLGSSTNSSTSSSIGFLEPSGVYAYTIAVPAGYTLVSSTPASPISVTSSAVVVNVLFAPVSSATYVLWFNETGLGGCHSHGGGWNDLQDPQDCCRSSLSWSVSVNGVTKSTTNASIAFSEPNGTYSYTVDAPSGYSVVSSVPASPVTILGANLTVNVTFARSSPSVPLSITFQEEGLRWGTVWCVTLNVTQCSSGKEIVFSGLSPGTYAFNVSEVRGYTAHPDAGVVRLYEQNVTVTVRFVPTGHHHGGGSC